MRMAREAPAPAAACLVGELKAKGQHEGEDTFEKRLAVFQQAEIGGFVSKIDSDGVCSKDTGFIQPVHDAVLPGFVDGLRRGLHATCPAPGAH